MRKQNNENYTKLIMFIAIQIILTGTMIIVVIVICTFFVIFKKYLEDTSDEIELELRRKTDTTEASLIQQPQSAVLRIK